MATRHPFSVIPHAPWDKTTRDALADLEPYGCGVGIHFHKMDGFLDYHHTGQFILLSRLPGRFRTRALFGMPGLAPSAAALAAMRCNEDTEAHGARKAAFSTLPSIAGDTTVFGYFLCDGALFYRLRPTYSSEAFDAAISRRVREDVIGFIARDLSAHARIAAMSLLTGLAESFACDFLEGARLTPAPQPD